MSDDANVYEHPQTVLRRKVEQLEARLKKLEGEHEHQIKMGLVILQQYAEIKSKHDHVLRILDQFPKS